MPGYPAEMRFKKTWRPYQARVLGELAGHLEDKRLHLVAAPGSGKTVLGIDVARQLNHSTLILSPTLAIRDQWIDRLTSDFLPHGEAIPGWISTDVRRPEFLTVATYQLLHSACGDSGGDEGALENEIESDERDSLDAGDDEWDEQLSTVGPRAGDGIPALLNRLGFRTVVLDECHHLRNEWWKSLTETIEGLESPTIVALTATPPYDVAPWEWDRYMQVSGPVDAEIAAPELVKEGNLCPHQDYVYMSLPQKEEGGRIDEFREDVRALVEDVTRNEEFRGALASHPWVQNPEAYAEEILADPANSQASPSF